MDQSSRRSRQLIAPGFTPTKFRTPRTQDKLIVQFRNGHIDNKHEYTASQLRWTDTGHAWDIIAIKRA